MSTSSINDNLNDDIWGMFDDFNIGDNDIKDLIEVKDKEENISKCIDNNCNSTEFNLEDGNYICKKCNTLQEKYIDSQAEWRYYGHEDTKTSDPTRCGMPTNDLLPQLSLGSVIGNDFTSKN